MPRITAHQDASAIAFLGSLSNIDRGVVADPAILQKDLKDFARMMVPPTVGGTKQDPAGWKIDRNEYVKHYSGMTFVAVGAVAKKIAQQEAKVYLRRVEKSGEKLEPLPDHPLAQLFYEVNQIHTQYDLWYQMVAWRLVTGDSFWWKARNGFGVPVELWPMPSQWVWAIPSRDKFIGSYKVKGVFGLEEEIPAEDVLHIREPHIDWSGSGKFYGQPNLAAAAKAVDLEEQMFNRLYHQFKNFAPPGLQYSTDKELSEEQWYDMLQQINLQHKNAENTGQPILSHNGVKATEFRTSIRELDYSNSLMSVMDYILSVFGVPKAVVGLTKDYNRANVIGALMTFVENTINPLLIHLGQHLTQGLATEFGENIVVRFDPCTVSDRESLRKDVETCQKVAAITPNEVREALLGDKGAFETGGDRPLIPGNLSEATFGNGEIEEPEPEQPAPEPEPPEEDEVADDQDEPDIDDQIDELLDVDEQGKAADAATEVVAQFFRPQRRKTIRRPGQDSDRDVPADPQEARSVVRSGALKVPAKAKEAGTQELPAGRRSFKRWRVPSR